MMKHVMFAMLAALALVGSRDVDAQELPTSPQDFFASLSASARAARQATGVMPANLQNQFVGSNELVPKMTPVTPEFAAKQAGTSSRGGTSAFKPSWISPANSLPQRARIPGPKPKLVVNGVEAEPSFVFSPDDRRTYADTSYPYGAVTKVTLSNGGWCSGVLIGPRHVLTASHCVNWASPYPTSVEINRRGTVVSASARVINIYFYVKDQPWTVQNIDSDYAVLVLSSRLGDTYGWMGTKTYSSSWNGVAYWAYIGYASDIASGNYPIFQSPFSMTASDVDGDGSGTAFQSLKSKMDQIKGQSGGPTYAYFSGSPYVVATCSGWTSPPATNWEAGGSKMADLVNLARKDYP